MREQEAGLVWRGWTKPGDPCPFKAEADGSMTEAAFQRWAVFCVETFGDGEAATMAIAPIRVGLRWRGQRRAWPQFLQLSERREDAAGVPQGTPLTVTLFSFCSEVDRVVFVLAASGE